MSMVLVVLKTIIIKPTLAGIVIRLLRSMLQKTDSDSDLVICCWLQCQWSSIVHE